MGDSEAPANENLDDSPTPPSGTCDLPRPSIDILKEAKPSANIAITDTPDRNDSSPNVNIEATLKTSKTVDDTTEVQELKNDTTIEETIKNEKEKATIEATMKNKNDIFGESPNEYIHSTIFSVGGAPAKTIHQNVNLGVKTASNDTLNSNTSKQSQYRNPVTGIGVSSNDEFKNKPTKRKDGNPLLGVGYKDDETFFNPTHPHRIPPGGYSKGLW